MFSLTGNEVERLHSYHQRPAASTTPNEKRYTPATKRFRFEEVRMGSPEVQHHPAYPRYSSSPLRMKYHKYDNQDIEANKKEDGFLVRGNDEAFQHLSNAFYSSTTGGSSGTKNKKDHSMIVDDMFHAFEKKQNFASGSSVVPSPLMSTSPFKFQSSPESLLFMVSPFLRQLLLSQFYLIMCFGFVFLESYKKYCLLEI
jgi:hypothetical protein